MAEPTANLTGGRFDMSVAFSTKTVYEYLFSEEPSASDADRLGKRAVARFCSSLERAVTRHADSSPHYKYVFFDLGRDAVDEFFASERNRFLDFGDEVVFVGDRSDDMARRIEERYDDPVVTEALRVARREARAQATGDQG